MALSFSKAKDIVLIAGKGHEKYQEINGLKHQFDDMAITKNIKNKAKIMMYYLFDYLNDLNVPGAGLFITYPSELQWHYLPL